LSIVRITDGRVVEDSVILDELGLLQQLGATVKVPA
jgi:hypothetical protein